MPTSHAVKGIGRTVVPIFVTAEPRRGWLLVGVVLLAGCMTKSQALAMRTGQGEAMPVIDVKPCVAERIALMDEYRLHDETRKLMTRHPHVTVEEVPLDEPAEEDAAPPADAPTATNATNASDDADSAAGRRIDDGSSLPADEVSVSRSQPGPCPGWPTRAQR
jgi:hypothetical protein